MKTTNLFINLFGWFSVVLLCVHPGLAQPFAMDELTFVRLQYSMGEFGIGFHIQYGSLESWQVDMPTSEENLMKTFQHVTKLAVARDRLSLSITDPAFNDYAFAYVVEVGYMQLRDDEVKALQEWLLRGGFLIVDDFHGQLEWNNFLSEFARVFPNRAVQDIPIDHPIFHCYYDFDYFPQIPGLGSLLRHMTYEKGGKVPHCRGIFDDSGRLMVLVNHNVDLGDSWEHAADWRYDRIYSRLGYMLGINYLVYALTH